jgi:hypothetical protein
MGRSMNMKQKRKRSVIRARGEGCYINMGWWLEVGRAGPKVLR